MRPALNVGERVRVARDVYLENRVVMRVFLLRRIAAPYNTLVKGRCAGEVSRGEKMLYSGTDPESYITEYTLPTQSRISPSIL